jgi:hypothetical protein
MNKVGQTLFIERIVEFSRTEPRPTKINKFYSNWWKVMVVLSTTAIVAKMLVGYLINGSAY